MSQFVFVDGKLVEKQEAKVSVFDHGYLYGDGVFEGLRMYAGNIFKCHEHLKRLYESAHSILLDIPYTIDEIEEFLIETLRANELQDDAYIRLIVSRGAGQLCLDPFKCPRPQLVIIAEQMALFPKELHEKGITMVTVPTRRNRPDVLSPKVKSMNYLNNILVKAEATKAGANEALMLNTEGYVAEGSGQNIFIVKNDVLFTPPGYVGALEGITRQAIIDLAHKKGYVVKEEPFTRHDVYVANEVFLTGTAAEVVPVIEVDSRQIGDGLRGPYTKALQLAFQEIVTVDGVKVYEHKNTHVAG